MKGCMPDTNFKGKGWSSKLFTILLILTWELRYPQKRGVNRKRGGLFKLVLPALGRGGRGGREANKLPWRRKDFPGGAGVEGNYTDKL